VLDQLPARYRTTSWVVGVLTFAAFGAWLAALAVGPLVAPVDIGLGAVAGAALGTIAVHAFLAMLAPVQPEAERTAAGG